MCLNYDLMDDYAGFLKTSKNFRFKMEFSCATDVSLVATLTDNDNEPIENTLLVQKNHLSPDSVAKYEIDVSLQPDKNSQLNIFSQKKSDEFQKKFWCASFYFESVNDDDDVSWNGGLCKQNKSLENIYLVKPLEYNLRAKENHDFLLFIDVVDVCDVVLIDGENNFFTFERSEKDAWSLSHYCNLEGELSIAIKLHEESVYSKVFLFQIV
jgi:hypothetical protein